jgi:hypothetical protein
MSVNLIKSFTSTLKLIPKAIQKTFFTPRPEILGAKIFEQANLIDFIARHKLEHFGAHGTAYTEEMKRQAEEQGVFDQKGDLFFGNHETAATYAQIRKPLGMPVILGVASSVEPHIRESFNTFFFPKEAKTHILSVYTINPEYVEYEKNKYKPITEKIKTCWNMVQQLSEEKLKNQEKQIEGIKNDVDEMKKEIVLIKKNNQQ